MSARIGIIGFTPIRYMPYLRKYRAILDGCGLPYDVICFDREGETPSHDNIHVYHGRCFGAPKYMRAYHFWGFRRFVRRVVRENRYGKLIVLTTLPAVLLCDLLLGRYAGHYLLDYRDMSYEHVAPFRWLLGRLARSAGMTAVSSPAFAPFLPGSLPVLSHNAAPDVLAEFDNENEAYLPPLADPRRVVLTYLGHIGYWHVNRHLVEKLSGVPGIELRVIGVGWEGLRDAARTAEAANVVYRGRFEPSERMQFYRETDLVANVYGADEGNPRNLLSNKLYEAACYRRPLLVSRGTLMEQYVRQYDLGLAVDPEADDLAEAIRRYATGFDLEAFDRGRRRFLDAVRHDDRLFAQRVLEFCQA